MDTSPSLIGLLGLGFGIGLKHALDADHLAAVATMVGRNHGFRRASLIGAVWGLGHTAALLAAGLLVLLLDLSISERIGAALELGVAVMLGWLGFRLIDSVLRGDTIHGHWHSHGALRHRHPHAHRQTHSTDGAHDAASHDHFPLPRPRPFLVGLVHGVAGSAGLLLLVLATVPDRATGLLFILVFGLGSIGGMCAMSALLSLPFAGAARWSSRLLNPIQVGAAVFSIAVAWSIVHEFLGGMAR